MKRQMAIGVFVLRAQRLSPNENLMRKISKWGDEVLGRRGSVLSFRPYSWSVRRVREIEKGLDHLHMSDLFNPQLLR